MYRFIIGSIIIFSLLGIFIHGTGTSDLMVALLSVASFLFGIFLAFAIANRQSRLNSIRTSLRKDDALLFSIYKLSACFGTETQNKCRLLIDAFLINTIDCELVDYDKSVNKFNELFDFFLGIEPKTDVQKIIYDNIIYALKESTYNKKELIHWLNEKMLGFEWGSLLILGSVILMSLFIINNNSAISVLITVLLGTSLVLFLLILRELDNLSWKEGSWIWYPLAQLFIELDLIPYIPKAILDKKKISLKKGVAYRVVEYPNPYPDFSDKIIKIIKN